MGTSWVAVSMRYLSTKPLRGAVTQLGHGVHMPGTAGPGFCVLNGTRVILFTIVVWTLIQLYLLVMASKKCQYEDMTHKELVQELRTHKAKVSGRKRT